MVKKWKDVHRWVGIIIAAYVAMATISGFVHIIAHSLYPAPKEKPAPVFTGLETVRVMPSQLPLNGASAISLKNIGGQVWYQVVYPDKKIVYFNAVSGDAADIDAEYAKELTRYYLGKMPESVVYVDKFGGEYTAHGKSLPVWKVSAGDERVYVSTISGVIELYQNPERAVTGQIFRNLHTFKFIPWHLPRDIFMGSMVIGLFAVNLIGVWLFFKRKKKKKDKERERNEKN